MNQRLGCVWVKGIVHKVKRFVSVGVWICARGLTVLCSLVSGYVQQRLSLGPYAAVDAQVSTQRLTDLCTDSGGKLC